jgi:hypothetical protein
MPGPTQPETEPARGFALLIGSIVVTVGVMIASLVIAANNVPR